MCRKELFPTEKKDEQWLRDLERRVVDEVLEERERIEAENWDWSNVVGNGYSPYLAMGGGFF